MGYRCLQSIGRASEIGSAGCAKFPLGYGNTRDFFLFSYIVNGISENRKIGKKQTFVRSFGRVRTLFSGVA